MPVPRPIPGWSPSTPEVHGSTLDNLMRLHSTIAVHFWAAWNGYDPLMDDSIRAIRSSFEGRVYFASCNTDLEENGELCRRCRLTNLPALVVFVSGTPRGPIIGFREPGPLSEEIEARLREPM